VDKADKKLVGVESISFGEIDEAKENLEFTMF